MQKSRVRRVGALIVGLSLVAAACGGDDDDAPVADESSATTTEAASEPTEEESEEMTEESSEEMTEEMTEESSEEMTEESSEEAAADPGAGCTSDGVLTIGTILPVTGDLAFLGPPEIAGAALAAEDINAAGGVLGVPMVLEQGDSVAPVSHLVPRADSEQQGHGHGSHAQEGLPPPPDSGSFQ